MKQCTPTEQRNKLEKALISALNVANEELIILGPHYKEENLRYVVMTAISLENCFGVFPNRNKSENFKLCFQTEYNGGYYKPDIVSLCFKKDGSPKKINSLVIELKTNASKTEIDSDLKKAHHYLKKVGDMKFLIAVVITVGIPVKNTENYIGDLNKLLQKHRTKVKARSWGQNLLFAWFNPLTHKPELFWLNQDDPIKLGVI